MRIGFIVQRINYYKFFSPIIDESLKRGYKVYSFHNFNHPKDGIKGYNFPNLNNTPSLLYGSQKVLPFDNSGHLAQLLSTHEIDYVISLETPDQIFLNGQRPENTNWALIQHGADVFDSNTPETLLNVDLFFCWSDEWVRMGEQFYKIKCPQKIEEGLFEQVKSKIRIVGFPQLDSTRIIRPNKVRLELGIEDKRPIILYFPLPRNASYRNYWETNIFPKSRHRQLIEIFRRRRWGFVNHWWNKWNDHELVNSIREFADKNDAYLIVKAREKNPIQDYLAEKADLNIYDESDYPPTILKLLKISDLAISFYKSFAALEAVRCNVPFISFIPIDQNFHDVSDWMKDQINQKNREAKATIFNGDHLGSIHNYDGVTQRMEIPDVIDNLGSMHLSGFTMDQQSRVSYIKKYLGFDDGNSASRLLARLETEKFNVE